ncbi:hypothetical protein SHIRM173S_06197 [Streptomyces hirsutus]
MGRGLTLLGPALGQEVTEAPGLRALVGARTPTGS